jgi:autotransporter translocation and assembly factor TamB
VTQFTKVAIGGATHLLATVVLALLLVAARLPPGQAVIEAAAEAWLGSRLQGEVQIGRLRTNLWDELRLDQLEVRLPGGTLRVAALHLVAAGGPPWSDGLRDLRVAGVHLRRSAAAADVAARPARSTAATGGDLRHGLPDVVEVTGLRVDGPDSSAPAIALEGRIVALRGDSGLPGIARWVVRGDSLDLHIGAGRRPAALRAGIEVGRRWVAVDGGALQAGDVDLRLDGALEAGAFDARVHGRFAADIAAALLPPPARPEAGTFVVDVAAHGPLADPLAHLRLRALGAAFHGTLLDSARIAGRWTASESRIDTFEALSEGGRAAGRAAVDHGPTPPTVEARVHLQAVDLARLPPDLLPAEPRLRGLLTGRIDLATSSTDVPLTSARVDVAVAGAQLGSTDLGRLHLAATWSHPALAGTLETALGRVQVGGRVEGEADHALTWHVDGVDLRPLSGWAGLAPILGGGSATVRTGGPPARPRVEGRVELSGLRLAGLRVQRLRATGQLDTAGAFHLALTDGGERTHLLAAGNWRDRDLHLGTLAIGGVDVSRYLAGTPAERWRGRLTADLDLQGNLQRPQATGLFRVDDLALGGRRLGDIHWRVELAEGRAGIGLAALDSTVRLVGTVELEEEGLPFQLRGGIRDAQLQPFLKLLTDEPLGYEGDLRATLRLVGSLADPAQMDADVGLLGLRVATPAGELSLEQRGTATLRQGVVAMDTLVFGGTAGRMRVGGRVDRDGPLDLHYHLEDLGLDFLEPFLTDEELRLRGRLRGGVALTGTADNPRIVGEVEVDGLSALDVELGSLSAAVAAGSGALRLESLDLLLPAGGALHGHAAAPYGSSQQRTGVPWEAALELRDVRLDAGQGLPDSVRGAISGMLSVSGPRPRLADLTGLLRLDSLRLTRGPHQLAGDRPLDLRLVGGELAVRDTASLLVINGARPEGPPVPVVLHGATGDRSAGLRLHASQVDLEALASLTGTDRLVRGTADLEARLRGSLAQPDLSVVGRVPEARVDSVAVDDVQLDVHYGAGELTLRQLRGRLVDGEIEAEGGLLAATEGRRPWHFHLAVSDLDVRPLRFWSAAVRERLDELAGRLSGELRIDATGGQPAFQGTLGVRDGIVSLGGVEPRLTFQQAVVSLSQDSLTVSGLEDRGGDWRIHADARLDAAGLRSFAASLRLQDMDVGIPGTMRLTTAGDLLWQGTPDTSTVSGGLIVRQGRITEAMSLRTLAFVSDSTAAGQAGADATDLRLARVGLDVALAATELNLDNELAQVPFTADLRLHGTAAQPVLEGEFVGAEGLVQYLGHDFTTERVRFQFDKGRPLDDLYVLFHQPARLDPRIDFLARTEVKARNGNEYVIRLGLAGPYSDIDLQLTSDPPEEEMDVLSLLRFGRTGVPMLDPRSGMLSTKANLSPDYLLSMTESGFGRVLGLDNVEIDNSVLRPGRLSGSRIVLTKQLGKRTEMTYSTTVGYAAEGRVQLQYSLGHNVYVQTEHDAKGESGVDLNWKLTFE